MSRWFALESNPEVMAAYAARMGLDTTKVNFHDVLSVDDWALEMIPTPVYAVLMLFPIKEASEIYRAEECDRIKNEGQVVSPNVYYMHQTVGNACGTVGILHAIGNIRDKLQFDPDCYLQKLFSTTRIMSPSEIAEFLAQDSEIETVHESAAMAGQSEPDQTDVNTHFICFTVVDGHLYELDGRKAFPINHGSSSTDTLLNDACAVIREFMARDPDEMRFTIIALAAAAIPESQEEEKE
eukprot:gene2789-5496_t